MTNKTTLENDYERMVPEFHKGTLIYAEHFTRYKAALEIVKGKVVLDIASGSGYGTKMLASSARQVYGVDVDRPAIEYAEERYNAKNITYLVGDGEKIPLDDNTVDVVVTFETIEHIKDYKQFMSELKRVLKDDGIAIISTPNELEFAEGNHFHLHEFEHDELKTLVRKYFSNIEDYFQSTWKSVSIDRAKPMESSGDIGVAVSNLSPKSKNQHLYFYMLCSNRKITEKIEPIVAFGEHYSERELVEQTTKHRMHIKSLEDVYVELNDARQKLEQNVEYQRNEAIRLSRELETIKNSKAYKHASNIHSVMHKLKRN